MRYAYIKSRNVVDELKRIGTFPERIPDGGPDAYLTSFLRMVGVEPTLLLSGFGRNAIVRIGNVEGRGYRHESKLAGAIGAAVVRVFVFVSALLRLLRFRPDRILCGRPKGPLLWSGFIAARLLSVPFVYSCHSRIRTRGGGWYEKVFLNGRVWIIRHASAVICHGPYLRKQLLDIGIPPTRLYAFSVGFRDVTVRLPTGHYTPNGNHECKDEVILFVGRVQANKGVFDLLDACTELLLMKPFVKLVYVGEGSDLRSLQDQVIKRDLTDQVTCMGKVSHDAVGSIIRRSKCLVTPTRSSFPEGWCKAALEGLVSGIPVIAPDSGPFPYMITHGVSGLLFKTNSVQDLRNKIRSVLDDDHLYNTLRTGATQCGKNFIDPPLTFTQAVEKAFATEHDR